MSQVESVRGPIASESLGATLMHEHVFIVSREFAQDYPAQVGWDEEKKVAQAIQDLQNLKDAGIDTIVDLTVLGLGRHLPRIKEINAAVDINIIAASGLYSFDPLPDFLKLFGPGNAIPDRDPMADMWIKDITEGIGDTGVKAAILKCCTDKPGVTPNIERILRSVARAHRATGVPISTHTDPHLRRGLEQQDIFESEGVDLSRVVIGHSGDTNDLDYLETVLKRGSYLGMDRFGIEGGTFLTLDERVKIVADLCERGYADKMVLSHDTSSWMDQFPQELRQGTRLDMPNWHYLHISQNVLPALRASGVTDDQIQAMMVDNPRKIFEANSTY
jgi:phosphotriesterase-related protein